MTLPKIVAKKFGELIARRNSGVTTRLLAKELGVHEAMLRNCFGVLKQLGVKFGDLRKSPTRAEIAEFREWKASQLGCQIRASLVTATPSGQIIAEREPAEASAKGKRKLSRKGRASISAAATARWAKYRAQKMNGATAH